MQPGNRSKWITKIGSVGHKSFPRQTSDSLLYVPVDGNCRWPMWMMMRKLEEVGCRRCRRMKIKERVRDTFIKRWRERGEDVITVSIRVWQHHRFCQFTYRPAHVASTGPDYCLCFTRVHPGQLTDKFTTPEL